MDTRTLDNFSAGHAVVAGSRPAPKEPGPQLSLRKEQCRTSKAYPHISFEAGKLSPQLLVQPEPFPNPRDFRAQIPPEGITQPACLRRTCLCQQSQFLTTLFNLFKYLHLEQSRTRPDFQIRQDWRGGSSDNADERKSF